MKYLYNIRKTKSAAHIWTGDDTACRMLSTGGMRMKNKELHDDPGGKKVCLMCETNYKKIEKYIQLQD